MRYLGSCGLLIIGVLFCACGGKASSSSKPPPVQCPAGDAPGTVKTIASGLPGTEGIAFSNDGRLFVAAGDNILEIHADGTTHQLAKVPKTVGMISWNGALFVASGDDGTHTPGGYCADTRRGGIYKVGLDGEVSLFATGIHQPNFIVATPWNSLLVADDCLSNFNIYEIDAKGNTTVWLNTLPSANGLAFDPTNTSLYVATTFDDPPPLFRVPVTADHKPGTAVPTYTFDYGTTPDGVVLDADGNIYVALNIVGQIHKVTPEGTDSLFVQGLGTPASLVFGHGTGFDPCSMYVTSLVGDKVSQVRVGTPGLPLVR